VSDLGYIALFLCVGGFFAVHCSLATVREWKAGRALGGQWGDYDREASPAGFWLIMTGNALAAVMGAALLLIGLVYLSAYLG
jgi:hypothetical protein